MWKSYEFAFNLPVITINILDGEFLHVLSPVSQPNKSLERVYLKGRLIIY